MSSPSFFTAAGNFLSAIQGSVDPRTGLFNVNLPLADLRSGNLAGPGLKLALRYSPLSDHDDGFGRGFALNLTRYDLLKRRLYLSTGESYAISSAGTAIQQHQTLNILINERDGYISRVIHKSGLVEDLTLYNTAAYTRKLTTADGRSISFRWDWNRGGMGVRLSSVTESWNGRTTTLCRVNYSDNPERAAIFSVLPEDPVSGYEMVFRVDDGVLYNVTSYATDPGLTWSFGYSLLNTGNIEKPTPQYLISMSSSAGLKESVTYPRNTGTFFPDGIELPPLPRVSTHIINPGNGQQETETRWEWTEENYLGRGVPGFNISRWSSDVDAMLIKLAPDYTYASTAIVYGCRVYRRYNSFHQLILEHTVRGGKEFIVRTDYYSRPDVTLNVQPRYYQLPMQQIKTWRVGDHFRNRITRWSYDIEGNLIKQWSPDGTITEYTWYHPQGEGEECPADPHGFRRYLKRKKVTPRRIQGDEVNTYTRHYWKKLDSLSGDGYIVLPDLEEQTTVLPVRGQKDGGIKRLRTWNSHTYHDDRKNMLTYGREKQLTTTYWPDVANSPDESYTQVQDFSYASLPEGLSQTETLTTHDHISLTRSTLRHSVLGYLLSDTDTQGVVTKYTRDKAGRMLTRTHAMGTPFEITFTRSYSIEKTGPVTIDTDPRGNQTKVFYDSIGREVTRQLLDLDGPPDRDGKKQWYEMSFQGFNYFGEVEITTHRDWLTLPDNNEKRFVINSTIYHDGFGNPSRQIFSDGVTVTDITDPVSLTRTTTSTAGSMTSATRTTVLSPRQHLPMKQTLTGGGLETERKYRWDGHHRLREMTDENGGITTYTWDDSGRLLTQTLPDGTVVARTWARHLGGDYLTGIRVTGQDCWGATETWVLGEQKFDGLGRLISSENGGRTTTYTFSGASPEPDTATTPSGCIIRYTRAVPLNNVLTALSAGPGTESQAASVEQVFTHDPLTGSLLTATEGNTVTENTLFPSGLLKGERFTSANAGVREAGYTRMLGGAMSGYKDPAGKKMILPRDAFGRITGTLDNDLATELEYDPLGRVASYTSTDPVTKATLTTTLTYDALDREKTRTVIGSNGKTMIQSLTWFPNGQLMQRVSRADNQDVLTEKFTYDARNRLTDYSATGSMLPEDGYGQVIKAQSYAFDALNNLTFVTTTLDGLGEDVATYHYDNIYDPMQLTSVEHTHDAYPKKISLSYDADGRMTQDETGRMRSYDAAGRLVSVSGSPGSKYSYDALNRMVVQMFSGGHSRTLYYRGGEQICELKTTLNTTTRFIKSGHTCYGVNDGSGVTLTAGDRHDSLMLSLKAGEAGGKTHIWSPYGGGDVVDGLPGFNGEHPDPFTRNYHLGNGYRAWSPRLMRFTCPDSLSPFGAGGINPYAYCAGDPVNLTDPSGHISWQGWLDIGLGILGLGAMAFTAGLSIAAAGGLMSALASASAMTVIAGGVGVMADVTAIASGALEEVNPQASRILGWGALGAGIASIGLFGVNALRRTPRLSKFEIRREMKIDSPRVLGTENFQFNPHGPSQGVHVTYTAIDFDSGVPRLNIVVHGEPGRVLFHRETWMNADQLYQRLAHEGVMRDRFYQIRMLTCYSADAPPGGVSVAARMAQLTGLPVEGYHGRMVMTEYLEIPFLHHSFGLRHYVNTAYVRGGEAEATALMQHYRAVISIEPERTANNIPETFVSLPGI